MEAENFSEEGKRRFVIVIEKCLTPSPKPHEIFVFTVEKSFLKKKRSKTQGREMADFHTDQEKLGIHLHDLSASKRKHTLPAMNGR